MKLSVNCIQQILTLRNQRPPVSTRDLARRFSLPRHVVLLVMKHARQLGYRTNVAALEIPETLAGVWECPACGGRLEFAPCVKCGPVGAAPRQIPLYVERRRRRRTDQASLPIVEQRGYELMAAVAAL